ncbi:hypothetical protein GE21DRAFT_4886 [Neurospora crassa]|uniref:Uncharacterized protein n=1 Tax=Neurospora crassa (strain ATCC 24698 / 74-OR23-1A / CBS 708.71 / DSM 1257 / FGSC 987) TaxID=367110 RepID=Q7S2W3_NEUCR|nr:hypothetical protein NCU09007 [Neurospora crassa OR74A]EAA29799.1 hypothetical protein NCU09007 [Neurospora crassa OR74A]KHE81985.1 hypothetical protein GE21DRAFT_4886 [Neurospora crassa]|eukprot:XP_959035.1 hypothetical protein NCU09007 [Neurospora crassa OR74A]
MDDASSSQQLVDTSQSTPDSQNEPITNTMTPSSFFSSNDTPSNHVQQPPADIAAPSALIPKPASTRGGTRGRGRGGRARGKGRVARAGPKITVAKSSTAIPKPGTGRGRRQRAYQYTRAQAAYERNMELRSAYSQLARLAKPVLDEIGSREKKALMENPQMVEEAPEYQEVMRFLDQRRDDTIATSARRLEYEKAMALNVFEGQREAVFRSTTQLTAELCEEWYTSMLAEVERLEFLHDNKLPLDLPPAPCTDYTYKDISQKQMDEQGRFAERDDEGDELPCSGKKVSELMTEAYQVHSQLPPKRKADGQLAGEPNPKMVKAHTSSLLGGTDTIPGSKSNTPEPGSKAPSPVPFSPSKGGRFEPSLLDPPLPKGAEEPDEYGVRLIQRKDKRAEFHNNRIMVPPIFEFDDDEIGFRDSTNDPVKGATKAKRGRFYMTPNSNYFYVDRRVSNWDSTQVEGELDEEIVKQYGLHPKMGIPLSSSTNVDQPPMPHVSGWKPVVLVDPRGQQVHASRTIKAARLDAQGRKFDLMNALRKFCEQEGIPEKELAPSKEEREQKRRQELELRGLDPDQDIESQISQSVTPARVPSPVNTTVFDDFVQGALQAAAADEEAERTAAASRSQASKPFDAIRDALMDNSTPAPAPQPLAQQPPAPLPTQETQVTGFADTTSLSYLADVAERESQEQRYLMHPYHHQGMQSGPSRTYSEAHQESTPIDPSLLPPQSQHNSVPRNNDFERPQHYHHVEYPRPEGYGVYAHQEPHPNDGSRPNDFLRTALNPSAYPPPPESHPGQYQDYSMQGPATGRTPFSTTASSKGLPALRPMHGTPGPDGQVSPVLPPSAHPSMVVSNSGAFYPPAPNRPFHNGYSAQESPVPMQAAVHHLQGMSLQPPPGHAEPHPSQMQMHHYPMPPQPYQNGPIPLAPAPGPMQGPVHIPAASPSPTPGPGHAPPMLQPAPPPHSLAPMPGQSMMPTAGSPPPGRSRPGSSSAPSGPPPSSGASAASNKYRKLEPAPTPPHRLGYTANGQELRTVQFDYREAIKDYTPVEPPPRHGPTHIRGWTHNNLKKGPGANSSRPTSSKGAATTNGVNGATNNTTNGDGARAGSSSSRAVSKMPVVFPPPVIFQAPAPSPIAPQVPTPPPAASQSAIVSQGPTLLPASPISQGAVDPHVADIPQNSTTSSQASIKPVRAVRTADRSLLVISASAMKKFYRNKSQSATSSSSVSSASDNNSDNDDKGPDVVKEGIEIAAPSPALTPATEASISSSSTKRKRASTSEDSRSSNGPKRVKFISKRDAAPVSVGEDASSTSTELPQLRPQSPSQQRKQQQRSQQEGIIMDTITVATISSPDTAKSPTATKRKSPTAAKNSPAKTPSRTPAKRKRAAVKIKQEEGSPSPKRVRIKKENKQPRQPAHSSYRLRNRGGPRLEFKENSKGEMELVELGDEEQRRD